MANKGVHYQIFMNSDNLKLIDDHKGNAIIAASFKARQFAEEILTQYVTEKEALSIAKALILGIKTELDTDTRSLYAETGVMHILAVSGLHVGIVYFLILLMLGQSINQISKPRLVALVAIPLLWSYAFITGLSPSVLRAVTMFSLIVIAQAIDRKSNTINTVAISAFLLLIINPLMLFSVGFQLSYLAVYGIILIYPYLIRLYSPKSSFSFKIWQLMVVSISAQIATFPLGLFYFHKFPTYFLLGNLLAVPAAMVIVWIGILLLPLAAISSWLGVVIGGLLTYLIMGLNWLLTQFQKLPWSAVDEVFLSRTAVVLIYMLITSVMLWLITQRKSWFVSSLVMSFILATVFSANLILDNNTKSITFYEISNHWAIDFNAKGNTTLLSDTLLTSDQAVIDYQISPNRLQHGWQLASNEELVSEVIFLGQIVNFYGRQILIANRPIGLDEIPEFIDYSLIPKQKYRRGEVVLEYNEVICVNGFANYKIHDLRKEGALVIDL